MKAILLHCVAFQIVWRAGKANAGYFWGNFRENSQKSLKVLMPIMCFRVGKKSESEMFGKMYIHIKTYS